MATKEEIAVWLVERIRANGRRSSYQSTIVKEIRSQFGEEWSYKNHNGNWAIDAATLRYFRTIKPANILWDRSDQSWNYLNDEELADHLRREAERAERIAARDAERAARRAADLENDGL